MLALNFGEWSFWEVYNPPVSFGQQKVTFDGPNKLILINEPETDIDFRTDIYSNWKEWKTQNTQTNSKFLEAISVVGGDPLPGNRVLGSTFFLENGWRLRTWNGDHILTVTGNVFTREGDDPFVPTTEDATVTINLNTSTLVETIETGALAGFDTTQEINELWKLHGLDIDNPLVVTGISRTSGTITQDIDETTPGGQTTTTVTRTDT